MSIYHQLAVLTISGAQAYFAIVLIACLTVLWLVLFIRNLSLHDENVMFRQAVIKDASERRLHGALLLEACKRVGVTGPLPAWIVRTLVNHATTFADADRLCVSLLDVIEAHARENDGPIALNGAQTARLIGLLNGVFAKLEGGRYTRCPRLAKPAFVEIQHRLTYIRDLLEDPDNPNREMFPELDPGHVLLELEVLRRNSIVTIREKKREVTSAKQ